MDFSDSQWWELASFSAEDTPAAMEEDIRRDPAAQAGYPADLSSRLTLGLTKVLQDRAAGAMNRLDMFAQASAWLIVQRCQPFCSHYGLRELRRTGAAPERISAKVLE